MDDHDFSSRLSDVEKRIVTIVEQNKAEHDTFKIKFADLEKYDAVQNEKFNSLIAKVDELISKMNELTSKPAKRWDSFIWEIIKWALVTVLAVIAVRVGLKV